MSFEEIVKNEIKADLNKSEYVRNFKGRVHMSKSRMDMYSGSVYLGVGDSAIIHYADETETRYIAATGMSYDAIISLFDVNTRSMMVCRLFRYDRTVKNKLDKFVKSLKRDKPNIEARIIGMQSNQDGFSGMLNDLLHFFIANRIKLLEVDMFGSNTRHVAMDAKLGTSYNILMEDRIYRAGELVNSMTIENFENALMNGNKQKK